MDTGQIGTRQRMIAAAMAGALAILLAALVIVVPYVSNFQPIWEDLRLYIVSVLSSLVAPVIVLLFARLYWGPAQDHPSQARDPQTTGNTELNMLPAPDVASTSQGGVLSPYGAESKIGPRSFAVEVGLDDVVRIDFLAMTGQLEICPVCELIEKTDSIHARAMDVRVLLRSDSSSDTKRIKKRAETKEQLDRVRLTMPAFRSAIRHYSFPCPLRAMILEHSDGTYSGHLSFYDWRAEEKMSARDTEVSWCYLRARVPSDDRLLALYRSWFTQLWGRHALHTLIFDFDDTLFQTTEIQVDAWIHGIRTAVEAKIVPRAIIAKDIREVLDDDYVLRTALTQILLQQQQEKGMLERLFPKPLNKTRLAALSSIRLEKRNSATAENAIPFMEITKYLSELCGRYQLVVVSATSESSIRQALKAHRLESCFSYVFGKEATHSWKDIEGKTPLFVRVSNVLGVPMERMAFVGDSNADFRAARQLGLKFIESRLNARRFNKDSLIDSRAADDDLIVVDSDGLHTLPAAIAQVEAALALVDACG